MKRLFEKLKHIKIPIYSQIKSKLESKGLDSTSSSQISWFVCSMVLFCFCIFRYDMQYGKQYFFLLIAILVYMLNLLHIKNILPLILVIALHWIWIIICSFIVGQYNLLYLLIFIAIMVIFCIKCKEYRFLLVFCFGNIFIHISMFIFYSLGGLEK